MERYDVAVIGTGPAGVSAAVTIKVRNKSILLFGKKDMSEKVRRAYQIFNYTGLPEITGKELAEKFSEHLDNLNICVTDEKVNVVYAMGDYFAIQTSERMYEATTVILATGMVPGKYVSGEKEFLGNGVSYCATCDALMYKDKTVAVIGYDRKFEKEAYFLADIAKKVYYIPMYGNAHELSDKLVVKLEVPVEITGSTKAEKLVTSQDAYDVDGVFILRDSIMPEQLVPGIALQENHIAVNSQMETNLPGCFACGDIVGRPYQYIKAAGQGNVAAFSAAEYLDRQRIK